jgi:hypothetical protein
MMFATRHSLRVLGSTALLTVVVAASGAAAARSRHRLPSDYHWGRCLLVVDGKTRISGACGYEIEKNGDFQINGPRQVYGGIDFPANAPGFAQMSRDYWANIFRDGDHWTGYGNSDVRATHGDTPWGILHRRGDCYVNRQMRACLWRR